jgi:hypothetical protein
LRTSTVAGWKVSFEGANVLLSRKIVVGEVMPILREERDSDES